MSTFVDFKIEQLDSNEIPNKLKEIPEPPKKLFYRGTWPNKGMRVLAVVGSRKFTTYGREVCEKLIRGLAGYPIVILSGLALGIDTIAHETAIDNNILTMAIPGSGLDEKVIYPSSNKRLAEKILDCGGLLLSEYEPDFHATAWSFPRRNRLMAGLADAVLVIEAEIKSGTLITARLATDYNRDVMTVPGSIFSDTSEGPNLLLKLGAIPITSSQDILEAFGLASVGDNIQKKLDLTDCSPNEIRILQCLDTPVDRDELSRRSGLSARDLNQVLTLMELKGMIKENAGEIYKK
ncbi:MAG: DNA-processing protein DprA [bacterium]